MSAVSEHIKATLEDWQVAIYNGLIEANNELANKENELVTSVESLGRKIIEGLQVALGQDQTEKQYKQWVADAIDRSVKTVEGYMTVARHSKGMSAKLKASKPSVFDHVIADRIADEKVRFAIMEQASVKDGLKGDARTAAIKLAVNDYLGEKSPEQAEKSAKAKATREGKKIDAGVDFLRPLVLAGLSKDQGQSATLRKYFLAGVNAATSTDPLIGKDAAVLAFDRLIAEGKAAYTAEAEGK